MATTTIWRVIFSIILLASVLYLPFWVSFLLLIVGLFFFDYYAEGVIIFFVSDLLYGTGEGRYLNVSFVSLFISLILFLGVQFLKKRSLFKLKHD